MLKNGLQTIANDAIPVYDLSERKLQPRLSGPKLFRTTSFTVSCLKLPVWAQLFIFRLWIAAGISAAELAGTGTTLAYC